MMSDQTVAAAEPSLRGFRVVISGAVPERDSWTDPAQDRAILEFVAHFCGMIFKYDGHVVHGCHPTFTPIVVRQAEQFAAGSAVKPLTLVMSELWAGGLTDESIDRYLQVANVMVTRRVGSGDPSDPQTRNHSLTLMRHHLVERTDAVVAVGGLLHRDGTFTRGVEEELLIARAKRIPCFLVGSLGGTAGELAKSSLESLSSGNGMTMEQCVQLADGQDITATAGVLAQHFISERERLLNQRATALNLETFCQKGFPISDAGYADVNQRG